MEALSEEDELSCWMGQRKEQFDKNIYRTIYDTFNPLVTAVAVLIYTYLRGIRANGFCQTNTAIKQGAQSFV